MIADTPEMIDRVYLITLRSMLKLEAVGMRKRGPSALSMAKKLGYKGKTAKAILPLFEADLRANGLIQ